MKNKKPAELSDAELIESEKKMKAFAFFFAGILIVSFATQLFFAIKNGFSASIGVPIALFPILIILFNNWNELKKEMKSRNL